MGKIFLTALIFLTPSVFAATSIDMIVTGQITPPSCDLTLANGNFDFGSSIVLNATGESALPTSAAQTLAIICSAPAYVGVRSYDNRAGTSTSAGRYGLGTDNAGNNIGYYTLPMSNIIANGATGFIKYTRNDGSTWTTIPNSASPGDFVLYSVQTVTYALDTNSAATPPGPITSGSMDLKVSPTIAPRNTLDTNNPISLDGSATIELIYL